jgi:four helix bundle suffix protein
LGYVPRLGIERRSRQRDQMTQAARSGVQNIAEGSMASGTSRRSELKLTGVARASLEELLLDYEDFLRQRGLRRWHKDSPRAMAVRRFYKSDRSDKSDQSDQLEALGLRRADAEAAANIIICLLNQASFLLNRQLSQLESRFLGEGGMSERMFRLRSRARVR